MAIQIASLIAKIGFRGKAAQAGMKKFATATKKSGKDVRKYTQRSSSNLESLQNQWKKFGKAAKGALGKIIDATPQLQADMLMIQFQIRDMFRTIGEALAPVFDKVVEWVTKITNWVKEKVGPIAEKIKEWWAEVAAKFEVLKEPIEKIKKAFQDFWVVVQPIVAKLLEMFGESFMETLGDILNVLAYLLSQFSELLGFITDLMAGDFSGAIEHLKNMFKNWADWVINLFKGLWQKIIDGFTWLWEKIGEGIDIMNDMLIPDAPDTGIDVTVIQNPFDLLDLINDLLKARYTDLQDVFQDYLAGNIDLPENIADLFDYMNLGTSDGGAGGTLATQPIGNLAPSSPPITVNVNVDASGSTASPEDIAMRTAEAIGDKLSDIQNW
jgi:hypothetical protein